MSNTEGGVKNCVVRLNRYGYFGEAPWTPVPLACAIRMSAKKARAVQNRLSRRGYNQAEVEVTNERKL